MRHLVGVPGVDFTVEDVRQTLPAQLEVTPLKKPPDATIRVPGSKSVTNRALIIAALAEGDSRILNPLFSDDTFWLMNALVRLGIGVRADIDQGEVYVSGQGGGFDASDVDLFVGNAGTVARFLPPVLALGTGPYTVDGVPRMRERPVADLVDAMRQLGASVDYAGEDGRFPLTIKGGGLRGGPARFSASKSSQFISGLLMAAPYAEAPVTLYPEGRKEWPYVGITTALMRAFGVEVVEAKGRFTVDPAPYSPRHYEVEPDASGASYFMAAAAVTGGRVRIPELGSSSPQGDLRFADVLREMGCRVEMAAHTTEVTGPDHLQGRRSRHERVLRHHDHPLRHCTLRHISYHHKERSPYPPAGDRPPARRRIRTEPPRHKNTNNPFIYTHNTRKDTARGRTDLRRPQDGDGFCGNGAGCAGHLHRGPWVREQDVSGLLWGIAVVTVNWRGFRIYFLGPWEAFS